MKNITAFVIKKGIAIPAIVSLLFFSQNSYSQEWSDIGGATDFVNATVVYNGDLIVGGRFTSAGGVSANYIAKWDGTSWSALGTGMDGWVNALTVYNGELIAGGSFTYAGGVLCNFIARWDGTSWNDVSGGLGSIVAALTVYDNKLIAGGYFTDADGYPVNYIAQWSNDAWSELGTGMDGSQGQVMALTTIGSDLYAAGFFTSAGGVTANHIAKWDGTAWSALGDGIGWIVYSLATYNGNLIAGGYFTTAGSITANSIASWDGTSWSTFGTGMGATNVGYDYVFALAVYHGNLYAGGMYLTAGGVTANGIAKWDGNAWTDLQGGVYYGGSNAYGINTLCVYGDDLYAGGLFSSAGSIGASHIAKWHEVATNISSETPNVFHLYQNYPNPFSLSTVISYHLAKAEQVKLVVFDITGKEITTLVNDFESVGFHSVEFNAANYPCGEYFCKIECNSFSSIRKMVQVK